MLKLLKSCLAGLAVAVSLVAGLAIGSYATGDNIITTGVINISRSGARLWAVKTASNGNLVIYNSVTGKNALQVDDVTSALVFPSYTTAQLALLAPNQTGAFAFNTTTGRIVRSTGTAAGNWSPVCGQLTCTDLGAF
jgi:hypothetical protein